MSGLESLLYFFCGCRKRQLRKQFRVRFRAYIRAFQPSHFDSFLVIMAEYSEPVSEKFVKILTRQIGG